MPSIQVLLTIDLNEPVANEQLVEYVSFAVQRLNIGTVEARIYDNVWHCNICGGTVDLHNATKPTAHIGPGGRIRKPNA